MIDSKLDKNIYKKAIALVEKEKNYSAAFIQRNLKIGYATASIIVEKIKQENINEKLKN